LYIKISLALFLLSSNVGHFSSSSMLVTDEVLWYLTDTDTAKSLESFKTHLLD
jgi:hypothetical protein